MDPREQSVADFILAEVARITDLKRVGLAESFMDLGADSIAVLRLAGAIEERFDVGVDIVDIFQSESLEELSKIIAGTLQDVR